MADKSDSQEVGLEEARCICMENGKKFVWLGGPTRVSIPEILEVSDTMVLSIEPDEIIHFEDQKLSVLDGFVFVCPHGRTSLTIAKYLKGKGVGAYSLKGGVAGIVGENY